MDVISSVAKVQGISSTVLRAEARRLLCLGVTPDYDSTPEAVGPTVAAEALFSAPSCALTWRGSRAGQRGMKYATSPRTGWARPTTLLEFGSAKRRT